MLFRNTPFYLSNFLVSCTVMKNRSIVKSVQRTYLLMGMMLAAMNAPASGVEPPRLIIFISVDQMREDYFDRFAPYFTGGLKRLYDQGMFFSNANLNYASTVTCLGHAALSTVCT